MVGVILTIFSLIYTLLLNKWIRQNGLRVSFRIKGLFTLLYYYYIDDI